MSVNIGHEERLRTAIALLRCATEMHRMELRHRELFRDDEDAYNVDDNSTYFEKMRKELDYEFRSLASRFFFILGLKDEKPYLMPDVKEGAVEWLADKLENSKELEAWRNACENWRDLVDEIKGIGK